MLKTQDLTLHYGGSQILYGKELEAVAGQGTCDMGTKGVGKTSLLKAISGTHQRSGGTITLDDQSVGRESSTALAKRGIGYVPLFRMIFPFLSVLVYLLTCFACLPKSEHMVPDEIFELFPVLKEMQARRGGDLSGGQQQQLAIARAMITKPKLMLLDEPTEGIQPNIIQQIGRVIEHLRDQGNMAIVLVEQYFEFAYGLADRFYVLERGRVSLSGQKSEIEKKTLMDAVSV